MNDYEQARMIGDTSLEEMVTVLRNWFDLEDDRPDSDVVSLMSSVMDDWIEVRKMLETTRCSYRDVMTTMFSMDPEFMSKDRMQDVLRKHRPLKSVMDDDGYILKSDACQDVESSKDRLMKYFMERTYDGLSKEMVRTYHNFFLTLNMVVTTGVHLWTSIMVYESMNPGCTFNEQFRRTVTALYVQR